MLKEEEEKREKEAVMRIKYQQAIKESEEAFSQLEQGLRGQKAADRVRLPRLLKSEKGPSLKEAAPLVG
jgi:hypothetical protein